MRIENKRYANPASSDLVTARWLACSTVNVKLEAMMTSEGCIKHKLDIQKGLVCDGLVPSFVKAYSLDTNGIGDKHVDTLTSSRRRGSRL